VAIGGSPVPITRGMQIGYLGNSGTWLGSGAFGSSGHLHFDVNNSGYRLTNTSNSLNPERFFPNIEIRGFSSRVTP